MSDPKSKPRSSRSGRATQKQATFEGAVERLTQIVDRLESGELPLEQSLELFEEGMRLARATQQQLNQAERRVEELLRIDEHGNPVTERLDPPEQE
jgi:exodeoxyribonuclease VII small subunit